MMSKQVLSASPAAWMVTSSVRFYSLEGLRHVRALVGRVGNSWQVTDTYAYDSWGNLIARTGTTQQPFTWNGAYGYEYVPFTGLYHVGAREYDPRTARWLQRDPIGVAGGHPNVYLYCGNDPINATDPSWQLAWDATLWGGALLLAGFSSFIPGDEVVLAGILITRRNTVLDKRLQQLIRQGKIIHQPIL
jgi:RHS repeat-associated protein